MTESRKFKATQDVLRLVVLLYLVTLGAEVALVAAGKIPGTAAPGMFDGQLFSALGALLLAAGSYGAVNVGQKGIDWWTARRTPPSPGGEP